jgi:hypothetical protein
MDEIQNNGPVQIAFKVYSDFFMYKSGVYSKHPNAKLANVENPYHSVKVLGKIFYFTVVPRYLHRCKFVDFPFYWCKLSQQLTWCKTPCKQFYTGCKKPHLFEDGAWCYLHQGAQLVFAFYTRR